MCYFLSYLHERLELIICNFSHTIYIYDYFVIDLINDLCVKSAIEIGNLWLLEMSMLFKFTWLFNISICRIKRKANCVSLCLQRRFRLISLNYFPSSFVCNSFYCFVNIKRHQETRLLDLWPKVQFYSLYKQLMYYTTSSVL